MQGQGQPRNRHRLNGLAKASCPPKSLRFFRVAAAITSLSAVILALEISLRVFDRTPHNVPQSRPPANDSRNALGLREPWDTLQPWDSRLRIAFLGDSFTYGEGVEPEETFCHRVEEYLADDWPTGVVTINAGLPGSAPGEHAQKYLGIREDLCPHIVIHVIYPNDLSVNLVPMVRHIRTLRDDRFNLSRWSRVSDLVESRIRNLLAWHETLDFFNGGRTPQQREQAWRLFESQVRDSKSAVNSGDGLYALVLFPWLNRLDDHPLRDWHSRLARFAEELQVPFLDLYGTFEGLDETLLRVNPDDEHPSPFAHDLAARQLARFISDHLLPTLGCMAVVNGLNDGYPLDQNAHANGASTIDED